MCPKAVDEIANSVDPDQTAPLGAVRSGSALFAEIRLLLQEQSDQGLHCLLFPN